jgi:hypothetical protein
MRGPAVIVNTDLIVAVDPTDVELGDYGSHEVIGDFREAFPTTDGGHGNHDVSREMASRLSPEVREQLVIDPEFSCLYLYGPADALGEAVAALQAMVSEGWGAAPSDADQATA